MASSGWSPQYAVNGGLSNGANVTLFQVRVYTGHRTPVVTHYSSALLVNPGSSRSPYACNQGKICCPSPEDHSSILVAQFIINSTAAVDDGRTGAPVGLAGQAAGTTLDRPAVYYGKFILPVGFLVAH